METSVTYKLLVANGSANLSYQVNNYLRDGWKLVGGASVTNYYDNNDKLVLQYTQAVLLEVNG